MKSAFCKSVPAVIASILFTGTLIPTQLVAATAIANFESSPDISMWEDKYGWPTRFGFELYTLDIQNNGQVDGTWSITREETEWSRYSFNSNLSFSVPAQKNDAFDFSVMKLGIINGSSSFEINGKSFRGFLTRYTYDQIKPHIIFSNDFKISTIDSDTGYQLSDIAAFPPDMRLIIGMRGIIYTNSEWEKLPSAWRAIIKDWCAAGGKLTIVSFKDENKKPILGFEKIPTDTEISKTNSTQTIAKRQKFGQGVFTRISIQKNDVETPNLTEIQNESAGTPYNWEEMHKSSSKLAQVITSEPNLSPPKIGNTNEVIGACSYISASSPCLVEKSFSRISENVKEIFGEDDKTNVLIALFYLLFFIIIVPVNIIICKKKNIALLYLTIPAISAAGALLLFVSIFALYGTGGDGKIIRLTYLNPETKKALTTTQYYYKTGLLISRNFYLPETTYLTFPPETETANKKFYKTNRTEFSGDWFMNNSRGILTSVAYEDSRASLHIKKDSTGTPIAYSELPTEFSTVIFMDEYNVLWKCENLSQGGKTAMKKIKAFPQIKELTTLSNKPLGMPDVTEIFPGTFYAFAKTGTKETQLLDSIEWTIASDIYYGFAE